MLVLVLSEIWGEPEGDLNRRGPVGGCGAVGQLARGALCSRPAQGAGQGHGGRRRAQEEGAREATASEETRWPGGFLAHLSGLELLFIFVNMIFFVCFARALAGWAPRPRLTQRVFGAAGHEEEACQVSVH